MTHFLSTTSLSLGTTRPFTLSELTFQNQSITWPHDTWTHYSFIHSTPQRLFYHHIPVTSPSDAHYKERPQVMYLHISHRLFFLKLKECEDRKVITSRLLKLILKYETPFSGTSSLFFLFKKIKALLSRSSRPLAFLPENSLFSCASFDAEFKSHTSLRNISQMLYKYRWEWRKDPWGGPWIEERRHCSHPKA